MGACMSQKGQGGPSQYIGINSQKKLKHQVMFSKEQSMLLDMWHERHIDILRVKFNEVITNRKTAQNSSLDYNGFLKVFDHSKRQGYERGSSILKVFGPTISKQAFKLFDRQKSGTLDFRDFCCALSIICLGSINEKFRFLYDLFDLDNDGLLSRKEMLQLLTQISQILIAGATKNHSKLRVGWIEHQIQIINQATNSNSSDTFVDFILFKQWAEQQIDIFKVLSIFELVPTPWREHEIINHILENHERKHGDTMYAVSFRWWDTWKDYTEKHNSTTEVIDLTERIRTNILIDTNLSDELKNCLFGQNAEDIIDFVSPSHKQIQGNNINSSLEKNTWAKIESKVPNEDVFELSHSMQQQLALTNCRTGAIKDAIIGTPKQLDKGSSLNFLEYIKNEESFAQHVRKSKTRQGSALKSKKYTNIGASLLAQRGDKSPMHQWREKTLQGQQEVTQFESKPSSTVPGSRNKLVANSQRLTSSLLVRTKQTQPSKPFNSSYAIDDSQNDRDDEDLLPEVFETESSRFQANDQLKRINSQASKLSIINQNENIEEVQRQISRTSFGKIDMNLAISITRPSNIDNSYIEGEHPGQLQLNLIMFRDFIVLPEEAWNILVSWYGLNENSPIFPRKVLIHNSIPNLELYPPRILCILADRDGKPIPDSQKSLFVSSALSISEVHLKICEMFNYISTRDTRLWVKGVDLDKENQWSLVNQQTHNLKDGDVFMVEVKFYGNQWSMDDGKASANRDWRQFEIGDKIDVKDGETWKVGYITKILKDSLQIHLHNQNYKHDLQIKKDSNQLAQFGQYTLTMHFTQSEHEKNIDGVYGIQNIGNTCYMSACIQCLLHTPLYKDYFKTQSCKALLEHNKQEEMISAAFSDFVLLSDLQSKNSALDPTSFKKVVNSTLPLFYGNQQHDAAEFFNFMLDKMNEEMNRQDKEADTQSANSQQLQSNNTNNQVVSEKKIEDDTGEIGGTGNTRQIIQDGPSTPIEAQIESVQTQGQIPQQSRSRQESLVTVSTQNVAKKTNQEQNHLLIQEQAISEAKQTIYDQYFNRELTVERSQKKLLTKTPNSIVDQTRLQKETPDSLYPNITPTVAKAKSAWYQALKNTNSPITDLFVGQQTTQITCLTCNNKSHTFENFYSLPVPLPTNLKCVFYINLIPKATSSFQNLKIQVFGIQINKYLTLQHLCDEIRSQVNSNSQFAICELAQNRIYRVHEDYKTSLFFISKRTNQLYFYEMPDFRQTANQTPSRSQRKLQRVFTSFKEIEPGMIVDARDQQNKWYAAIITAKEEGESWLRIRVHYYQLNENLDEWIDESHENLQRIKPFNSTGRAQQPLDQLIGLTISHRRLNCNSEDDKLLFTGMPYYANISNTITWQQFKKEITNQIQRHVKQSIGQANVDCIDDEGVVSETDQKDIKLQDKNGVERKILNLSKTSQMILSPHDSKQRLEQWQAQPLPKIMTKPSIEKSPNISFVNKRGSGIISHFGQLDTILEKPYESSFKIKIFCAETFKCVFCLLKQKYNQEQEICKFGCEIPESDDIIKWITSLFKKLEVFVDWVDINGESSYKEADILKSVSYHRYKKMESEVINGTPLGACLDLYSKKEKIEGYQCDHCKSQTQALLKPMISHLPDILILHMKRFNFEGGYLDKIEDLVTFPIRNLDMQKYVISGVHCSTTYDLYAVINHHIYQTGGHYTAAVQLKTSSEPIWVLANDSQVLKLTNPIKDLVKKDAYILLYKRKELTPSNILKLGDIV